MRFCVLIQVSLISHPCIAETVSAMVLLVILGTGIDYERLNFSDVVGEVKRRPQSTTGTKMMHGSHIHQWVPVEEQQPTGAEEKENENKSGSDRGPIQDLLGIRIWSVSG